LLAVLLASAPPPWALALLLLLALPLSLASASFVPPLPPVELALASPELPEVAVVSPPTPPPPESVAVAAPVLPVPAVLLALPPLASWSCDTSPPLELELFVAVVVEEAVELPERAVPEVSPESSSPELFEAFLAELLPDAEPPEAVVLLLFVALPLPETLALFEPPFPPVAELVAEPELPEVAEVLPPPPEPVDVAVAPPVLPEVALLVALPPFADWPWVASPPVELLLLVAVVELEESHVPEVELPVAPLLDEFEEPDEHAVAANATSWCDTICTAMKAQAAVAMGMATLTNAFFAIFNISPGFLVFVVTLVRRIDSAPMRWGGERCCDVSWNVLMSCSNRGGPLAPLSSR